MKAFKIAIWVLLGLTIATCQKEPERVDQDFIQISTSEDSLNLNLNSTAEITVNLKSYSPTTKVKFEITGGTIDGKTEVALTPSDTVLKKIFTPDSNVGKAYITVSIMGSDISDVVEIVKVNPAPPSVISATYPATSLSINQAEQMNFQLYLNPEFAERSISFTFNGGSIHDANGPVAANIEINAADGIWNGIIKTDSTKSEGYYPLVITVGNNLYTHQTNFWLYKEDIANVLSLSVTTTGTVFADGISTFNVEAQVSNHNASQITFTTTKGTFSNNQTTISLPISGGIISTDVIVSQEVTAHSVTAQLNNPAYSQTVTFTPSASLPETMSLVPEAWSIDSSATSQSQAIALHAYFDKVTGNVSSGLNVNAEAFQMLGGVKTSFGTFTGIPLSTDTNESVTTSYYGSTGMYPDSTLYIVFAAQGVSGTLADTLSLYVNGQ
ncbi:MAG: hypothetical protein HUJ25_05710 [Crocinitomicaceae bacterium]|nr:hypothetical protein [Crocinitomicaceae bacterium]